MFSKFLRHNDDIICLQDNVAAELAFYNIFVVNIDDRFFAAVFPEQNDFAFGCPSFAGHARQKGGKTAPVILRGVAQPGS
ncbi:MAG: hypothetical protein R6U68_07680, partial [Desulfobacteraceae bacterium]